MKKHDEFNKMIRKCKQGKIDMIIVKSISRFARNTLDCIAITRKLRGIGVDVYFEEQNLHSIDPVSEFYISIYGSVAQSESKNSSSNNISMYGKNGKALNPALTKSSPSLTGCRITRWNTMTKSSDSSSNA